MSPLMNKTQDSGALKDVEELEESFLSDVVSILRENLEKFTAEQEQDLSDFHAGKLDFDALYSKYWNEDGTWKDQLADLSGHLKDFKLDADDAITINDDADIEDHSSDSSDAGDSEIETDVASYEDEDGMDID